MPRNIPKTKIIVILGPTATGKSDLAVEIARKFNGEIISADSRQVYKGLDLGSGKITKREMKGVPHHLLDIANPKSKRYSVENFKKDGQKAIETILSKNKLPIICGGTGFYINTLIFDENFPIVEPNSKLRTELSKKTVEELMGKIKKLDPIRAKSLDPYNKVRIIRAIEIARALGKVPKLKPQKLKYDVIWIGLNLPTEKLHERISKRIIKRLKQGMLKEVENLHTNGLSWKRLYDFGLEYRYLSLYLKGGISKKEAIETLEREIRHFTKRQMTWFKKNKDTKWFTPNEYKKIEKLIKSSLTKQNPSIY